MDVADAPGDPDAAAFRTGEDGEGLVVGDLVRDATPGEAVVVTDLEVGRIWNRLRAEEVEMFGA